MRKIQTGDVYTLGEHRLVCGDCRELEIINKLMNGRRANLVFTDPPYGMKKEKDGVTGDNMNLAETVDFNRQWISKSLNVLDDNGSWYMWGKDEAIMLTYADILRPMIQHHEVTFRNLITWEKPNPMGQLSSDLRMYPIADEKCLFLIKGAQRFNDNLDGYFEGWEPIRSYLEEQKNIMGWTNQNIREITGVTSVVRHAFSKSQWEIPTEENYNKMRDACLVDGEQKAFEKEYKAFKREYDDIKREYDDIKREYDDIKREYDDIKREFYDSRAFFDNTHEKMSQTWQFNRASPEEYAEAFKFPTIKPVELCSRAIKSSSREGDLVVDFFGGSGSTLIACEELGRTCYMIELVPDQAAKIIARWEKKTGKQAKKEPRVARWILEDNTCRCSSCGFDRGESLFAFCPICGAEILGAG